ncbi:zf-HC2 domain-containing protein [Simiduia sp. 21SJ11W-1]|uniref:zf-HC2 domain-containing protein n=1 Tax=Simiduia sp. 21SJ11W-1 TaxID=2909669 RepID=UPI00209E7E81|nr:zf-HC2 domain-containing protein [Simiduia sp. 21SJ11W-1]UTA47702.1 zf-HC2 domain-containing protein [Simiduia sp. 21SJ11W-1]
MLKCKDIVARSSDYIEGELSGWARANYKVHLFMCTHCRRYLRHVQVAAQAAAKVAKRSVSDEQASHLASNIQKAASEKPDGDVNP